MKEELDPYNIPEHIAITMDGNRRWARARGLPIYKGHEQGVKTLEKIVETAEKLGVKTLTVYAMSTENVTQRAKREVLGLFRIMRNGYKTELRKMMKNGVKITVLGELDHLPKTIRDIIEKIRKTHIKSEAIRLNIALNYDGKREMLEAIKRIIKDGVKVDKINDDLIKKYLYTRGQKDPELVIRAGGRNRSSNFLIWQSGYSELYFTTILWPDFSPEELKKAIIWYQTQQRNFGK